MTGELRVKYLFLLGVALGAAAPAAAQDDQEVSVSAAAAAARDSVAAGAVRAAADGTITVTATGISGPITQSGQSISVLSAAQIDMVQGPDPLRLLERLPGVATSRNGPLGSAATVFVRGANSQQLLVTIDGVRVDDQAAPSGGFDFGTIVNGGVGRIELLRGSNSLAWGSDAIGGVLALTSDDRPGLRAGVEYGANNTFSADGGWALRRDADTALALNGGYTRSDGISAFAGGTEPDGFRQWHANGKGSLGLGGGLRLVAAGRYADSRIAFDGFPPPLYAFADTPEYQITRQASGRAGFDYASGGGFALAGGIALADTRRAYYDPAAGAAPNFDTAGRGLHADVKGRAELAGGFRLDFGGDADWARYATTYDPRQRARTLGAHALLGYHSDRVSLSAGGRIDDHDRFGRHWTMGANGSLALTERWRLRASWGQGFKAPSLSQLYGYGANPQLQPEESNAYDLALEYGQGGAGHFAVTAFRRDSTNLIDFVDPTGYFNVGRARAQGIELEGAVTVADRLTVSGAYTWLDAVNRATGTRLARRPRHSLSLAADWHGPAGVTLGADMRLVGDRFDDPGNATPLDGYGLITLRASVPVGDRLELYGRIENVADQSYQTAAGYGSYGRSAFAGVRLRW